MMRDNLEDYLHDAIDVFADENNIHSTLCIFEDIESEFLEEGENGLVLMVKSEVRHG